MSLIGKEIGEFKVQSFPNNGFKEVTKEDVLGKWEYFSSIRGLYLVLPTEPEIMTDKYEDFKKIGADLQCLLR